MTTEQIIETMKQSDLTYFGFRAADTNNRANTYMAISHDWDDYGRKSELLSGSSTIGISDKYDLDDDDIAHRVETALELVNAYPFNHIYLVGGVNAEDGNDKGEWIIDNNTWSGERHGAKVIAVIK